MSTALFATQGFQIVKYATYVEHVLRPLVNLGLVVVFICSARRYSGP